MTTGADRFLCPSCGESVAIGAKKCRFCSASLTTRQAAAAKRGAHAAASPPAKAPPAVSATPLAPQSPAPTVGQEIFELVREHIPAAIAFVVMTFIIIPLLLTMCGLPVGSPF